MSRLALLVAVGDWVTKALAARMVAEDVVLSERLRIAVVHNDAAAFGLSIGAYTWQLNLALTLAAIVFMIPVSRDLARIDPSSPRALGLIMGGAIGNLASLILSPRGVVDFISVGIGNNTELVLNVADLAAYLGLALVVRTAFLIVAEMRRAARPLPVALVDVPGVRSWRTATKEAGVVLLKEREVPVPVFAADRGSGRQHQLDHPRPESVRQAELADITPAEVRVIDIRSRQLRNLPIEPQPRLDEGRAD